MKITSPISVIFAIAGGILAPTLAHAGGFELADQGALASGTSGAATARPTDPAAAWYNPAALADGRGFRASGNMLFGLPNFVAEDLAGTWRQPSETDLAVAPQIYASYAKDDWAAGVALNAPFGGGVTWPSEWTGRFEVRSSAIQVLRVSPFFAWSFDELRVAGGLQIDAAHLRIERALDFIETEGDVTIDLRGAGVGAHAALYWEASENVDIGLSYRSRSFVSLHGEADFGEVEKAFSEKAADQEASSEIVLPDRIALGGRWHVDRVSLLADASLTLWNTYDSLAIDFESEETPDVEQETNWDLSASIRIGAEYEIAREVTLRGGAFFDSSAAPSNTLAPSSPDTDRVGASLGASVEVGDDVAIDAFYTYLRLLERESESDDALEARYRGQAHLMGLGIRYGH